MLLIDVAFSRRGSTTQRKLEKFIFAGGDTVGVRRFTSAESRVPSFHMSGAYTHTIFESSQ